MTPPATAPSGDTAPSKCDQFGHCFYVNGVALSACVDCDEPNPAGTP